MEIITNTAQIERIYLKRECKPDALKASEILKASAKSETFKYLFSVDIDGEDWELAHDIGNARAIILRKKGKERDFHLRKNPVQINTEGAMGEWVFSSLLNKAGYAHETFVASSPIKKPDLTFDDLRFDVKTVGLSKTALNVNQAAHDNVEKRPDAYLVARITREDTIDVYCVSANAVASQFKLVTFGTKSPYYQVRLPSPLPYPEVLEDIEEAA